MYDKLKRNGEKQNENMCVTVGGVQCVPHKIKADIQKTLLTSFHQTLNIPDLPL